MRPSRTLVWIDAREARIVTSGRGEIVIERLEAASGADGGRSGPDQPYLHRVADRVPVADDLTIIGPGVAPQRLATLIRAIDDVRPRRREVAAGPAERCTDRQLVSRYARTSERPSRTRAAVRRGGT